MNKSKFLADARKGMYLKMIRTTSAPSAYGLDKWRHVSQVSAKSIRMGASSLNLPDTKLMYYDGKELIIYKADNPSEVKLHYLVRFY